MLFKIYDYISGDLINQVSEFNLGDIIQNQHTVKPVVIQASSDTEVTVSNLKIFLESKGSWQDTDFGYFVNSTFVPSVESGSNNLSNHFIEVPNATAISPNGVAIGWDTTSSYYLWIDAQVTEQSGMTEANFRFFYDYT